jgi:hypothetical protein
MKSVLGLIGTWFGGRAVSQPAAVPAVAADVAITLPYPHVTVAGSQALATWERLRGEGKGWPVIIGDDEALMLVAEGLEDNADQEPAAILAAAARIRLPADLEKHFADEYGADAEMPEQGSWPPIADAQPGLTVASDILTGKPLERVHIIILPITDGSEAPAYLCWGAWNACPPPELHVALLRSWNARYGTELVGLSGDVLNLRAARRPATRDEAMALAGEQYLYCSDIVDQGTMTLAPLAASLMDGDWWFFWWD